LRPVEHVEAWLARAALTEGPLFRRLSNDGRCLLATPMSDRAVARVVQQRVVTASYDRAAFAGHSLRAGLLTSDARAGASVFKMSEVSRHKTVQVLADYVRDARLFDEHAGKDFL
jgi:hypothetical protein